MTLEEAKKICNDRKGKDGCVSCPLKKLSICSEIPRYWTLKEDK